MGLSNATGILLKGGPDDVLTQLAIRLVHEDKAINSSDGKDRADYEGLAGLLYKHNNYEEIAQGVTALVAFNPRRASDVVKVVVAPLLDDGPDCSKCYIFGAIIGLFDTAKWLDTQWGDSSGFDEIFVDQLTLALASHKVQNVTKPDPAVNWAGWPESRCKSRLDDTIKSYVQGGKRGHRNAMVCNIIERVNHDSMSDETSLSCIVVESISWGQWGTLSPKGRLTALNQLFGHLIPPLREA
jgi:hypothetical protein